MTNIQAAPAGTPANGRMGATMSRSRFLQGVFSFDGRGIDTPFLLSHQLTYVVPRDREAQLVYFRGGNPTDELICVVVMRNGKPMRWFPIGARDGTHVPLRVVEDLLADTKVEIHIAAPQGPGQVILDLGLVEV
jgi:hypothetical protein